MGIDQELSANSFAVGAIALAVDAARLSILAKRLPHGDEAAVGERRHRGHGLRSRSMGIDPELAAGRASIGIEDLAVNAVARPVLAVGLPDNDEAAVGERRNGRENLLPLGMGVDSEFIADHAPGGIEALAVNAGAAPSPRNVLAVAVGLPNHDKAAAIDRGHRGVVL